MLTRLREQTLHHGHNHVAVSAEHRFLGITYLPATGAISMSVVENTEISESQSGLVYRSVYVAISGEVLPFGLPTVLQSFHVPGTEINAPLSVFILPARKI